MRLRATNPTTGETIQTYNAMSPDEVTLATRSNMPLVSGFRRMTGSEEPLPAQDTTAPPKLSLHPGYREAVS
jgi:hypothetical protein